MDTWHVEIPLAPKLLVATHFHSPSSAASAPLISIMYPPSPSAMMWYLSLSSTRPSLLYHVMLCGQGGTDTWQARVTFSPIFIFSSRKFCLNTGAGPTGFMLSAGLSDPSRLPFPTTCTLDDEYALPMQLTASQVYVPRDVGSSGLAVSANTSPALISWPSLYQRSTGVGTPTTLHSSDTVPCSVSNACSSSRNSGALYAFGTSTFRCEEQEARPPAPTATQVHRPPSSITTGATSTQKKLPSCTKWKRSPSTSCSLFRCHDTVTSEELRISTRKRVLVPTFTARSVRRLRNTGTSDPAPSTLISMARRASPAEFFAVSV